MLNEKHWPGYIDDLQARANAQVCSSCLLVGKMLKGAIALGLPGIPESVDGK